MFLSEEVHVARRHYHGRAQDSVLNVNAPCTERLIDISERRDHKSCSGGKKSQDESLSRSVAGINLRCHFHSRRSVTG